ncbi:SDR family NAD(P)-dependent oxidoreductase [Phenylobacterium montanum]|uniref:SDR family NAD(P)-dependent oxidoreductase n=1 Tax=Phenylobacterium montanum TaxID=2823693 RepID=A0A975G3Z4_9CAUL|nr:SDR family NAD(P)-dependent oxidoreductase [Caulobacter sp. S6]
MPAGGVAIVVGSSGGIGEAARSALSATGRFERVIGWSRRGPDAVDITQEADVARASRAAADEGEIRLVLVATGTLSFNGAKAEKGLRNLEPEAMMAAFRTNALGPALVAKHLLPLFPRTGKSVFSVLSARVGSIGDNRLGGWYSYRASKAALNQLIRTASIELARRAPDAICLAMHPGTVDTPLSRPFSRAGLTVLTPASAAAKLLEVIDLVGEEQSGGFLDQDGLTIPW